MMNNIATSPIPVESYLLQITQFARYFAQSPELLGPDEIRTYQLYLATEKKLAPSSRKTAASARKGGHPLEGSCQ
jgi:hypothetical protein